MKRLVVMMFLCFCFIAWASAEPITVLNPSFEFLGGVDQSVKQTCVVPDDWTFGSGSTCEILEAQASEGDVCVAIHNVGSVFQLTGQTIAEGDEYTLNFDSFFLWSDGVWNCTFQGMLYYGNGGSRTVIGYMESNLSAGMPDWAWHFDNTVNVTIPAGHAAIGNKLGIELATIDNGGAANSWFGFDNVRLVIPEPPRTVPATFYIDSATGDDANTGLATNDAWASLSPVNAMTLIGGDQILFKAGTSYTGQLKPQGSGTSGNPIIIDMYGTGNKPAINGGGILNTVLLRNVEYYEISNLEITNLGGSRQDRRTGVTVEAASASLPIAHHIYLRDLYVHDVNGSNVKADGGGHGIYFYCNGSDSRFDDILVENCHLLRCDRNGLDTWNDYYTPWWNWNPSTNLVFRNNLLEDIGGDGIVIIGCDNALVEYNTIVGGRMRAQDYAAGMWPWGSTDTLFQFNEVSGMTGTMDGQAYDCDYECSGTIFQYNYSHDNDGGFMLVCAPGDNDYANQNPIIRYNISQNDGSNSRIFHLSGKITNTQIYNNVIYLGPGMNNKLIKFDQWSGGTPDGTQFYNNIFYADGTLNYELDTHTNTVFENNVFYGNHNNPPLDPFALTSDPMLVNPGSGGNGLDSVDGYMLLAGSPAIDSGQDISGNGGWDYWGTPVPDGTTDRGAYETANVPSYCADGTCDPGEDQCNCPQDCGTAPLSESNCTDGLDEDCDSYTDCDDNDCDTDPGCVVSYCGDGTCDPGEDECNCANDCGAPPATESNCTDGLDEDCDGGADCSDPTGDCDSDPACSCGNGVCDPGENCNTCSTDCISKTGGKPSTRYCCGDGTCEGAENETNCGVDCDSGSYCGDGTCDPGEDECNCSQDCGVPASSETNCTDGVDEDCDGGEDCNDPTGDCDSDPACQSVCNNNSICEPGEDCNNCSNDCASKVNGKRSSRYCCGNGTAEPPEGDGTICDGNY